LKCPSVTGKKHFSSHQLLAENLTLKTHRGLRRSLTPEKFLGDVEWISETEVFATEQRRDEFVLMLSVVFRKVRQEFF